jgi:coenzyme F420-reducing hydrogenase delta subunit
LSNKLLLLYCAQGAKKAIINMSEQGKTLNNDIYLYELPCTGRVNELLLTNILENGFDGVLVIACHRENCRFLDGNLYAEKRVQRLEKLFAQAGIKHKNVGIIFTAPDQSHKLHDQIIKFYKTITQEVEECPQK